MTQPDFLHAAGVYVSKHNVPTLDKCLARGTADLIKEIIEEKRNFGSLLNKVTTKMSVTIQIYLKFILPSFPKILCDQLLEESLSPHLLELGSSVRMCWR